MGKRTFTVTFEGQFVIELDDAVIDAVDADWRANLYDLETTEEIVEMVGLNMAIDKRRLSQLDGWADQSDDNAKIIEELETYFVNVKEERGE